MGKRYVYKGPVMIFGKLVTNSWSGETIAPTRKKAMSNLAYQFKKLNNILENKGKVTFVDKYLYEADESSTDQFIY